MKKIFKKEEILSNKGCYSREQVLNLSFINNREITLIDIMKSEISIQDKRWFLYNKGELSTKQKKDLALKLAWAVLPIYEDQYPGDNRVRDCLQDIKKFNLDNIFFNEAAVKRNAAAAEAAYAAAEATDAAEAADAEAVATVAIAAYAAAEAVVFKSITYSNKLQQIIIDFIINNE